MCLAKMDGYRNTFSQTSHSCCVLFLFDPFLKAGSSFRICSSISSSSSSSSRYLQTHHHRFFNFFFFPKLFSLQNRPRIFRSFRMRILSSSHTSSPVVDVVALQLYSEVFRYKKDIQICTTKESCVRSTLRSRLNAHFMRRGGGLGGENNKDDENTTTTTSTTRRRAAVTEQNKQHQCEGDDEISR